MHWLLIALLVLTRLAGSQGKEAFKGAFIN